MKSFPASLGTAFAFLFQFAPWTVRETIIGSLVTAFDRAEASDVGDTDLWVSA
jgi:hypothetical protein